MYGFPNPNFNPMTGMNVGGNMNWMNMYNTAIPNQNINPIPNQGMFNSGKINVIFRTTKAVRTNITIDTDKTVSDLIQLYFKRIGKPELFQRPMDICFIFNANKINFNEQKPVEQFFFGVYNPFITVNDTKDLIGA